ncbi:MAG TPA: hypothetical protein VM509_10720, partial [Planctomycetota bacterium]|nr:hypothetical protein [Planctomycetota bacterium]
MRFPASAPFELAPVSVEELRARAPHEVHKSETMNYRTMAPEPGGLFDPKLFGPGTVIDAPVPNGDAMIRPRKTWFARVALAAPMLHPLLVARARTQIAELLGRTSEEVATAAADVEASRALVEGLDAKHTWMVLRELAVLPPDLRPLKLDDHMRWALTPINMWYQRIINRNGRLKKLIEQGAPASQLSADWAELSAAIRGLAENDETNEPTLDADGDPMPSLRTLAGGTHRGLYDALAELAAHAAAAPAAAASAAPAG